MNLTIGKRLSAGFGVMAVLIAGLGVASYYQAGRSVESANELAQVGRKLQSVGDTDSDGFAARLRANVYFLDPSESNEQQYDKAINTSLETVTRLKATVTDPADIELAEQINGQFKEYNATFDELRALMRSRMDIFHKQCGPTGEALETLARTLGDRALEQKNTELARALYQTQADANLSRLGVARYVITRDDKEFEKFTTSTARAQKRLSDFSKQDLGEAWKASLDELTKTYERYAAIGNAVHDNVQNFEKTRTTRLNKVGPEVSGLIEKLSKRISTFAEETQVAATHSAKRGQVQAMAFTGVAVAAGIFAAIFISRSIIRPLRAVTDRLRDIAQGEGDLTQRVDQDRKDELGELGKWFNTFVARIQDLMKQVAASSQQVAAASTEIAASAEQMASGMKQQQDQTQQVSAAVEEMSSSVVEVAKKSSEAAGAAENSGKNASEGEKVVGQTVTQMQGIAEQVTESARAVSSLGAKSEQIGQIISVINDIADQTNLLALNAAIEAARAGEHGRGFAVVADEVRKLAERTTHATKQVADSIGEIQSETGTAVKKIEAGTKQVESGVELAGNAGQALSRIAASSRNLQAMVQAIAAAAEEQSAASTQIARSVESISAVTRESAQGASQAAQAAQQLSSQAESLQRLVGKFKV